MEERKAKELKLLENNINLEVQHEKQAFKESENKMLRLCNEKANAIKHELQRERKKREDDEE